MLLLISTPCSRSGAALSRALAYTACQGGIMTSQHRHHIVFFIAFMVVGGMLAMGAYGQSEVRNTAEDKLDSITAGDGTLHFSRTAAAGPRSEERRVGKECRKRRRREASMNESEGGTSRD